MDQGVEKNTELREKLLVDTEAGNDHHPRQSDEKKTAMTAEAKKHMADAMMHLMGKGEDVADASQSFAALNLDEQEELVPEPLSEKKCKRAQQLIKQKHPLQDLKIWKVLPVLKRFRGTLSKYANDDDAERGRKTQVRDDSEFQDASASYHRRIRSLDQPADPTALGNIQAEKPKRSAASKRLGFKTSSESVGESKMQSLFGAKIKDMVLQKYKDTTNKMYQQVLDQEKEEEDQEDNDSEINDYIDAEQRDEEDENDVFQSDEDFDDGENQVAHEFDEDAEDNFVNLEMQEVSQVGKRKNKDAIKRDPFIQYGVGIRNFFQIQERLMKLFCLLSLVALIQMIILGSYGGLSYLQDNLSTYAKYSLGNMGFDMSICGRQVIDWQNDGNIRLLFQCQGTTSISEIFSSGILMDDHLEYGNDESALQKCYMTDDEIAASPYMPYFNKEAMDAAVRSECLGKETCELSVPRSGILSMPAEKQYHNMVLYSQVGCTMDSKNFEKKLLWGLAVSCLGLAIVFFSRITFDTMGKLDVIYEKKLDAKLITVNDYTVEVDVTDAMYDEFQKYWIDLNHGKEYENDIQMFEEHLSQQIEKELASKEDLDENQVEIADLQFNFDNARLLKMLEKRATALRGANFEKASEIEKKMTDYKNENYKKLTQPNTAYVTFVYESAFLAMMNYSTNAQETDDQQKLVYQGEDLKIRRAYQPTNLLWENFEMTQRTRKQRFVCTTIFMIIFGISYFLMASYSNQLSRVLSYMKQPTTINCEQLIDFYGIESLETMAALEFAESYLKTADTSGEITIHMNEILFNSGTSTCYCKQLIKDNGGDLENLKQTNQTLILDEANGQSELYEAPMCYDFYKGYISSLSMFSLYCTFFSYFVVINATWIRMLLIWVSSMLRFRNLTMETNFTMLTIFYMNLLNYGAVYVLAPWDSRESGVPVVNSIFSGLYTDYNAYWFNDVGTLIVSTMVFNMFYPMIEFFGYLAIRVLFRAVDQRLLIPSMAPTHTRTKTLQAFQTLYEGPKFLIHWKYAYILNVVYQTMLFGPGLPVLFPVALGSIFVLYMTEKLAVAYSYQKPPMYDSTVNRTTIRLLKISPVFYVISAAWAYSNQQLFRNAVFEKTDASFYALSHHSFSQWFTQITPGTPFVMFGSLLFLWTLFGRFIEPYIYDDEDKVTSVTDTAKMVIDQSLDSYFNVLSTRAKDTWIKEEVICVKRNEMTRLKPKSFQALADAKMAQQKVKDAEKQDPGYSYKQKKKASKLQDVHNYDILANPIYAERYLYTPCKYPKRHSYCISRYSNKELRKSSFDLVRLVCDLPYLGEERAKKMQFTPEYIYAERLHRIKEEEEQNEKKDNQE